MDVVASGGVAPLSLIRAAARRISSSRTAVDFEGKTLDDYEQDLALAALTGKCDPAYMPWLLLRRADAYKRLRNRRKYLADKVWFGVVDPSYRGESAEDADLTWSDKHAFRSRDIPESPNPERRACVALLEKRLSAGDLAILRSVFSGTPWREIARRMGMSRATFGIRLREARERARALWGEESDAMSIDPATSSDDEIQKAVSCYGLMFSLGEAECAKCELKVRCVKRIVGTTMPNFDASAGGSLAPQAMADALGTDMGTVDQLYRIRTKQQTVEKMLGVPETVVLSEVAVAPEPQSANVQSIQKAKKPPKKIVAPVVTPDHHVPETTTVPEAAPAPPPPIVEKASDVKKTPPPAPKTAKASQKKTAPPAPAPKPQKKATAAKKKSAVKTHASQNAQQVAARMKAAKPPKMDDQTMRLRWERERARSPAVAALNPGTVVTKMYCGVPVTVTYKSGYVDFKGQRWPTMASVMTAIVGLKEFPTQNGNGKQTRAMTDWSVPRFFKLAKKAVKKAAKKKVA